MVPIVDVVILSWNRLEHTLEAIKSVRSQENAESHIWIVDQGSEPTTVKALRQLERTDPRMHLRELKRNHGAAEGRNIGMSLGSAECIVCIDNDAMLLSLDALAHSAKAFQDNRSVAAIGFRILDSDTGNDDLASWGYPRKLLARSDSGFLTTRYVGAGHAIRRSALEKVAGYDERLFFYWEELDLSYQFINAGYRIAYDPEVKVLHNISSEMRVQWFDARYYYYARNAVYLDYKFFGSALRVLMTSAGYLARGIYNGVTRQAVRGLLDAMRMIGDRGHGDQFRLSKEALAYIWENDVRYRGTLYQRIRDEILVPLPGLEQNK